LDSERPSSFRSESQRLLAAYGRRQGMDARYSWFDTGHLFLMQQRERAVLRTLARHGAARLDALRVLEVGCGNGNWLRDLARWGAPPQLLVGVDLIPGRLGDAVRLGPPGTGFVRGSGAELPFRSGAFDMVVQSTVFTSILDESVRGAVAAEMTRVLAPDGFILWYDYRVNNPANPDVRGIGRRELLRLFPACDVSWESVGLAPPLARRLAGLSWVGCLLLERVRFLRSHALAVIRRRGGA
jgi:SAM-dependent methyltransferase